MFAYPNPIIIRIGFHISRPLGISSRWVAKNFTANPTGQAIEPTPSARNTLWRSLLTVFLADVRSCKMDLSRLRDGKGLDPTEDDGAVVHRR